MNQEQIDVMQACADGALSGVLNFPQILGLLSEAGIERYHADYSRSEITYYFPDGASHVVSTPHPKSETAKEFSAQHVADAVRASQQGEHTYLDFIRKTMGAGCIGYFVHVTGGSVIYFGRHGETHTERFPAMTTTTP